MQGVSDCGGFWGADENRQHARAMDLFEQQQWRRRFDIHTHRTEHDFNHGSTLRSRERESAPGEEAVELAGDEGLAQGVHFLGHVRSME